MNCALARFSSEPCSGRTDPHHWIKQQRVRRLLRSKGLSEERIIELLNDPRLLAPVCRHHHDQLEKCATARRIVLQEADYPASLQEFASEHGFYFQSPTRGWVEAPAQMRDAA